MSHAVCYECVEDYYLKKIIADEGVLIECSVCASTDKNAFTVEQMGKLMEPIMREHFSLGQDMKMFGEDDSEWWGQDGEPMSWAVQEVLGQYFDFEAEIVDAVCAAEDCWPPDGDTPLWDQTSMYVESRVQIRAYYAEWNYTLEELRHRRRFFSPAAQTLFSKLFDGIDQLKAWGGGKFLPVARTLPNGTKLYRARICNQHTTFTDIYQDPFKHVGPPPNEGARSSRMNVEGVVVFYGAREEKTALAELRPAIGNEVAVITVATTSPLRILDFTRLEQARGGKALSYFQPDFTEEVEKRKFLQRLHHLISQPVIPGLESDYLITQTMAEYLAHVHQEPFDGILFASAQRAKGTNIVLFAAPSFITESVADSFRIKYVDGTLRLFATEAIKHTHREVTFSIDDEGNPRIHHEQYDDDDE
jgi:hypothetical protein